MKLLLIALSLLSIARCQVLVSMEFMSSAGTAPLIGRGIAAATVNVHVCAAGPLPVPFDVVRFNFPEIRLYSLEQQSAILSQRVAESLPARIAKWGGRFAEVGGVGVQIETALKKSPSQLGNGMTAVGLGVQLAAAWASKDVPKYVISNPVPQTLTLKDCADYTALAVYGKAPAVVGPRRVDPIGVGK